MDLDLHGRHALVCGASEGIGRATAHELALLGANVTVLSRRAEALQRVVDSLHAGDGQRHGLLAVDMADSTAVGTQVAALAARTPVHILVNNTGGPPGGPAHLAAASEYIDAFERHLLSGQALLQAVLPGMRAAGWGRIVNVVSTSVREPIVGLGVSNTIRAAVAGWAKTLSRELGPDGITVNNVLPGFTETARIDQIIGNRARAEGRTDAEIADAMRAGVPARRFARPEETGGVIAFLCSPAADYVNGVNLAVDGGRMASI
ncbi:MAG TPA: SDR family oxidoreductase [Luteimonas sp.]|nr:SDR family oxidoreductase [Luteimonas sp.]